MSGRPDNLGRMAASWHGRRVVVALAAVLTLGLAACAPNDPPTITASVLPPAAPRVVEKPNPERKRLIQVFGGVYSAPATQAYLDGVLAKLAAATDAPGQTYRVTVLNSPIVNAFSLPSGDIFVTRGLLALAGDTSEIAAVMAHEIGHITARHASQRAEFEKTTALFSRVNSQLLAQREAQDEVEARSKLAIARFSREQEFAADQIGIKTIARAGYDPYGAARIPHRARRVERISRFGFGRGLRQSPRYDGDPSLDPGAHRPGDRSGAPVRRARDRGNRARRVSRSHRRPRLRRRSGPGRGARQCVHSSKTRFRLRGAGGLHARQSVGRADRRRGSERRGAAPRQHRDFGIRPPSPPPSVRTGSTASRRHPSNPRRSTAWRRLRRPLRATSGASALGPCA